ncbi:DNA-binding response regulator [Paenibacillus faecis]|uniref:response regulator n=1 Tax=Paenibacillus faecis TaxID=862114 RepID=UPI001B123F09|nr:response regulator transcription factor [Paenibacillus faecis]GIO86975.1 DNA-binding response regulator [Paenibacillus faecis]
MKTRVLVVDDHAHAREAICEILAMDDQFEVIGVVKSGQEAIEFTEQWMPDLILMDIQMPGMDGLAATQRIKLSFPYVKIVMITVSDDMFHLLEALKRGAQGYLLKNLAPSTWIEYLRSIVNEEAPLSRELAFEILKDVLISTKREAAEGLTQREQEILGQVANGLTNKEIGETLNISEHTVKNHLKNILQKLQVQNRVQLTRYALEQGLVAGKGSGLKGEKGREETD